MSKIVLYMAISSDGFIAGPHGETPWSSEEWASFQAFVRSCDFVLLGSRTYTIMKEQDDFVEGARYVVVTHDMTRNTDNKQKIRIKSRDDIPKGDKIGVIGGGELNGSLAKLGLIDELILDIEPIKLGGGTRLFGPYDIPLKLKLIESCRLGSNTIQRHYAVLS
jgi:dihydrofolate reductase